MANGNPIDLGRKGKKPVVGDSPLWDEKKESLWMLPGYLEGIRQAGGIPFIFPFTVEEEELRQLLSLCDGFLFTGGQDVSPGLYQKEPLDERLKGLVECCEKRDQMELILLRLALFEDMPLLGICRGLQFINAALGGTLYQDLPTQHPSEVNHHQGLPYDAPIHTVHLPEGTPFKRLLGVDTLGVNSLHHQAIKDLSGELSPMATSPDGLVEAFYRPKSRFLWAVQWHPEFSYMHEESSRRIFAAFIEAMKSKSMAT